MEHANENYSPDSTKGGWLSQKRLFGLLSGIVLTCSVVAGTESFAQERIVGISAAGGEFPYDADTKTIDHTNPYAYVFPSQSFIDYFVKDNGLNAIRISTRWELLQRSPDGPLTSNYLSQLDSAVSRVTNAGAYAIIDIHNYGRFITGDSSDTQVEHIVGGASGVVTSQHLANLWAQLANNFKSNSKVMFELMNEPHDQDQTTLMSTLQMAINAIQDTGATNTILVPGNYWSGAHSWDKPSNKYGEANSTALLTLTDLFGSLVFVAHQYLDSNNSGKSPDCLSPTQAVAKLNVFTQWLRANVRRGLLGEFGSSANTACLASLDAMLKHVYSNDVYLGATYWATGEYWDPTEFYLIRPASLDKHFSQSQDVGMAQLGVLKKYLLDQNGPVIINQNASNAWYVPADGTRSWINQDCAYDLERRGIPRRDGNWNTDLAGLTNVSVSCALIKPRTDPEIVNQDASNSWYIPGDGTRAWINQTCAAALESNGIPRLDGSWNNDLSGLTGVSLRCDDLIGTQPDIEIVDQDANNAWFIPGDGTRTWINQTCAANLVSQGISRRSGNWNNDLGHLLGVSRSCSDLVEPQSNVEIIDQNASNAWFIPGDGTRTWINQGCADGLESQGVPRRIGNWNNDLGHLDGVSKSCSDLL